MGITRPKLYRLLWAEGLEPAEFRGRSTTSPSQDDRGQELSSFGN
jgi:hypothetical protein